jgi:hypothetical protein
MVRLKIIWFIIKTFFCYHGRGVSSLRGKSGVDVSYNITDDLGNYEHIHFRKGNDNE